MMTAELGPLIVEPDHWVLVFERKASAWWVNWLALGKYKHVRAYAYVRFLHVWLFYDVDLRGTTLRVAADGPAAYAMIDLYTADSDLIVMPRRPGRRRPAVLGFCVPSMKRLIGLRTGALRPTALYRDCLRHGGMPVESADGRRRIHPPAIFGAAASTAGGTAACDRPVPAAAG